MDIRNIEWKTYGETDLNLVALGIAIVMSIMFGLARLAFRGDYRQLPKLNSIDKAFLI